MRNYSLILDGKAIGLVKGNCSSDRAWLIPNLILHLSHNLSITGTTHFGELLCIIIRYVDSLNMVRQRLLELKLYDSAFSGVALSRAIMQALNTNALPFQGLMAIICDGASVNRVACDSIRQFAGNFTHISCISHGLDNVGKNLVKQRRVTERHY